MILETRTFNEALKRHNLNPFQQGFSTSRFVRWIDHKFKERGSHDWVKVHMTCGVKTNIVTAVEIDGPNAADTKLLPAMLATTSKHFTVAEVYADKTYSSRKNMELIAAIGATPFIVDLTD